MLRVTEPNYAEFTVLRVTEPSDAEFHCTLCFANEYMTTSEVIPPSVGLNIWVIDQYSVLYS